MSDADRLVSRKEWDEEVSSPTWVSPPLHAACTPETWTRLRATMNALFEFREALRGCVLDYPGSKHPAADGTKYIDDIAKELGLE